MYIILQKPSWPPEMQQWLRVCLRQHSRLVSLPPHSKQTGPRHVQATAVQRGGGGGGGGGEASEGRVTDSVRIVKYDIPRHTAPHPK